jgi:Glycosyltransferase family 92
MLQILGAEKIYIYYEYLHPEMFRIVQYFEEQEIVESSQYINPSGLLNLIPGRPQSWMVQQNTLNDCFYRVRNLYEYIAILDFDEVIMPLVETDMNWDDLLRRTNKRGYDVFEFRNSIFTKNDSHSDDVPEFMYMLRNTHHYERHNLPGKSLFQTETHKVVQNHYSIACLSGSCKSHKVNETIGRTNHYRDEETRFSSGKIVDDESALKFKDQLVRKVQETLKVKKIDLRFN